MRLPTRVSVEGYNVTVDTSSITGTAGSLDFNFNPGPLVTQAAALQIVGFASNGTVIGNAALIGDASGALPATVDFDNAKGFNDYFQSFTFGSRLSFDVSLFGPALNAYDGISTSGTTFAFSMFSDVTGTTPVLTTDTTDGFAFTIDLNLDATTTVNNLSPVVTSSHHYIGSNCGPRTQQLRASGHFIIVLASRSATIPELDLFKVRLSG